MNPSPSVILNAPPGISILPSSDENPNLLSTTNRKASSTISSVSHSSSQETLPSMSISDPNNHLNQSAFQPPPSWTMSDILEKASGLNLVSNSTNMNPPSSSPPFSLSSGGMVTSVEDKSK